MSSVQNYTHPTHHGHVEWSSGGGHTMVHKWAHGGPDVRKTYPTHEKAKAALHRAVKAGNVTPRAGSPAHESVKSAATGAVRAMRRLKG